MSDLDTRIAKVTEAVRYAHAVHDGQLRKGKPVPYIVHPIAVAFLVAEYGGGTDEMIAALLHDVPEDGILGEAHFDEITKRFGPRVAALVRACTETTEKPKPPWLQRKTAYVKWVRKHVDGGYVDNGYLRVTLADKVNNVEGILEDLNDGIDVIATFNAPEPKVEWTLGYYEALATAFGGYTGSDPGVIRLIDRFATAVRKLRAVTRGR